MTDLRKVKHSFYIKIQDKDNEYEREREIEREKKWIEYSYINPFSYNYSTKIFMTIEFKSKQRLCGCRINVFR